MSQLEIAQAVKHLLCSQLAVYIQQASSYGEKENGSLWEIILAIQARERLPANVCVIEDKAMAQVWRESFLRGAFCPVSESPFMLLHS
jgi:hypothetical protein